MAQARSPRAPKVDAATQAFNDRLKTHMIPVGYNHIFPSAPSPDSEDFDAETDCLLIRRHGEFDKAGVERLFNQYGTALELIHGETKVEPGFEFAVTFPRVNEPDFHGALRALKENGDPFAVDA